MYLELAENDNDYLQANDNDYLQEDDELYLDENGNLVEGREEVSPYIYVPGQGGQKGVYVREDYFDDLPDDDWDRLMIYLEANQPGLSLFGLGKAGRARRAERRERRHERRLQKITTRSEGRAGVARAGGGLAGLGAGLQGLVGSIFGGGQPAPGAPVEAAPRKPIWPWIVGGAVAIGGVIYLTTRKRRRR